MLDEFRIMRGLELALEGSQLSSDLLRNVLARSASPFPLGSDS